MELPRRLEINLTNGFGAACCCPDGGSVLSPELDIAAVRRKLSWKQLSGYIAYIKGFKRLPHGDCMWDLTWALSNNCRRDDKSSSCTTSQHYDHGSTPSISKGMGHVSEGTNYAHNFNALWTCKQGSNLDPQPWTLYKKFNAVAYRQMRDCWRRLQIELRT